MRSRALLSGRPNRVEKLADLEPEAVAVAGKDCVADSTCDEAEPVSLEPRRTSVIWDETCDVPAADGTLLAAPRIGRGSSGPTVCAQYRPSNRRIKMRRRKEDGNDIAGSNPRF
jgi:hypothetical protein